MSIIFLYVSLFCWHLSLQIQPKETSQLPDVIYLDKFDVFNFTMTVMPSQKGRP